MSVASYVHAVEVTHPLAFIYGAASKALSNFHICCADSDSFLSFLSHIYSQLRNEADTALYSTEKSLGEYKDKLPQAVVDEINTAIGDCREAAKVSEGML